MARGLLCCPNVLRKCIVATGLALSIVPARANAGDPELTGVRRVVEIDLPAAGAPYTLPGARGISVDVSVEPSEVEAAIQDLPDPFWAHVLAIEGGTRLTLWHPENELSYSDTNDRSGYHMRVGTQDDETRLRGLARGARRAIPSPPGLGPHLELWNEAQTESTRGSLRRARRLWEKLGTIPEVRDLAALRLAQLFVTSGHVNEALARLRQVSRDHPRSPGAALARIGALELQAVTGEGKPSPGQVLIAASSVSQRTYQGYTWLQAARAFSAMDRHDLALAHWPVDPIIPKGFLASAILLREDIVAATLGVPAARGDSRAVVARYRAWKPMVDVHPDRDALLALVGDACLALGLPTAAADVLRQRLAFGHPSAEEARIVGGMADAFAMAGDLTRHREAVHYQLATHPTDPSVPFLVRALAIREWQDVGLDAALAWLATVREGAKDPAHKRKTLGLEIALLAIGAHTDRLVSALEAMERIGFDDPDRRGPQLALALARAGRAAAATPRLRRFIGRITDPESQDRMAYHLAEAEIAQGRAEDGDRILDVISRHGTRWGLIARARREERGLQRVVATLESASPGAGGGAGPSSPQSAP